MVAKRQTGIPPAEAGEVVPMKVGPGPKQRPSPQTARSPGDKNVAKKSSNKGQRAKSTGSA